MDNKKKVVLGAAAVAALASLGAKDVQAATANMTAQAFIREAITLNMAQHLHFGNLTITGTGAGTITIAPDDSPTAGGTFNTAGGNLEHAAHLNVHAQKSAALNVSVSAFPVLTNGGVTVGTVTAFKVANTAGATSTAMGIGAAKVFNMPAGASDIVLNIGATMAHKVGAVQPSGTYTDAGVTWTVVYQ